MSGSESHHVYEFADFRLDLSKRSIVDKSGAAVARIAASLG
jgi:hypothetical protein